MLLSIITINLNNAIGLEKTIKSVLSQTSSDFEYLVIDGGSTDGSGDIIKKYADKISYWISEPDKGIYNAMNKGILKAKGEYCQFLNSGDYLISNDVTEKMLTRVPDCGILYGNLLQNIKGKLVLSERYRGRDITLLDFFLNTFNHPSAYIRKNLFEKYGLYDESLKIVSDWKFFLQVIVLHNEKLVYKDIDISIFDMGGISHSDVKLRVEEREKVLKELLPKQILADYNFFATGGKYIIRLRGYKFFWFISQNIDRFLAILAYIFCYKRKIIG